MFSGIIEHTDRIIARHPGVAGSAQRLVVDAGVAFVAGVKPGDSIAVSGACLTVVQIDSGRLHFDLLAETLAKTTLGRVERVNLERALVAGGRLDGHFVQGHVDGTGTVRLREPRAGQTWLAIALPDSVRPYCIPQGSIAVDGVSLTIAALDDAAGEIGIGLIPETLARTTLRDLQPGDAVNLEADMLGKYVVHTLRRMPR